MHTDSIIYFVHLFNNYSGSPAVLRRVIQACLAVGMPCRLLVGNNGGILDGLPVKRHCFSYRYFNNKFLTLGYYLFTQLKMFLHVLFIANKIDTVYINTMLPFGAALAAKICGCRVIYHVHEINIRPVMMKKFLRWVIENTADQVIFASHTLYQIECFHKPKQLVIYNAISSEFEAKALKMHPELSLQPFNILMICSPKIYKGIFEFVKLAVDCLDQASINFNLVLGANQNEISKLLKNIQIPKNITVYSATKDVFQFYRRSHLVLNLSRPDQCIETFGLTVLEAMACGIPVIVPPVGGPTELVEDGIQGFHVDSRDSNKLLDCLLRLYEDRELYLNMSKASCERAASFSSVIFSTKIIAVINEVRPLHE